MTISGGLSRSASAQVLAKVRTLRASISLARAALMHFHNDRVDRDLLEPAARRVDDLMDHFTSGKRSPTQGTLWVTEIQSGVAQVTNPKSATALSEARVDILALLDVMRADATESCSVPEGPGARSLRAR